MTERKRSNKKRQDYRQGGRVALASGNQPNKIKEPRGKPNLPYTPAPVIPKQDNPLTIKKDPAPIPRKDRPFVHPSETPPSNLTPIAQPIAQPTTQPTAQPTPKPFSKTPILKQLLKDPAPAPEKERPQTTYTTAKTPTTSSSYIPPDEKATQTQGFVPEYIESIGAGLPQFPEGATEGTTYTWTNPAGEVMNFVYTNGSWGLAGTDTGGGDGSGDGDGDGDGDGETAPVSPQYGIGTANVPTSFGGTGGRTPAQQQAARDMIDAAARGELTGDTRIKDPAQINYQRDATGNLILDDSGQPIPLADSETMQMDRTKGVDEQTVLKDGQRIGYDASTGDAITAAGILPGGYSFTPPEGVQYPMNMPPEGQRWSYGPNGERIAVDANTREGAAAATYGADTIDQAPIVNPQTGEWSDKGIADMQSQALTKAAQGIDFTDEQKSRGITERVVGPMDPQAKMDAVKVAGTDLPRVLRAKKQLRRAGLTEEQINLIGNDPSLLEDELMEYTEEQRGMIAGLPDEALVSTQMNALLDGMESGEIPAFARPAVAAVNEILAQRGLDVSTVGRDALFNAVIQSAMPLAQSNAQSIKESVFSQRGIEAQAEQMNAQMAQQRATTNSERVFNLNMAQFSADQQRALSNSKFLQTTSLTEVGNDQQAGIQEAVSLAQLDLATLDSNTKLAAQNAQTMLQRDVTDLGNRQQAEVLTKQLEQQTMLSNQAAQNAAQQFNATSENQTNQFMSSMAANMTQFNKTQQNAMTQFNKTQENQAKALEEQAELDVAKYDAQLSTQIDQFNSQQEFAREQFNTQNAQAVEQSNVAWRRQANTVNTAAINAVNQQNAQNAFGLSTQSMSFLWQELRDQMDYSFKAWDNDQQRKASLMVAALGNEGASYEGKNWQSNLTGMTNIMNTFLNPGGN